MNFSEIPTTDPQLPTELEGAEGLNIQSSVDNEDKVSFNEWMNNIRRLRNAAFEKPTKEELVGALKAIIARINGEWDNPELMIFGALHVDTEVDILRIAESAIGY
jgi:hypothetical protein